MNDNKAEAAYYDPAETDEDARLCGTYQNNARSIRQWRDRVAAVTALREAADALSEGHGPINPRRVDEWLRARADNLEAGL